LSLPIFGATFSTTKKLFLVLLFFLLFLRLFERLLPI